MANDPEDHDEVSALPDEATPIEPLLQHLADRCVKGDLPHELGEIDSPAGSRLRLVLWPDDPYRISISDLDTAGMLAATEFELLAPVPDYEAMFNSTADEVTVLIRPAGFAFRHPMMSKFLETTTTLRSEHESGPEIELGLIEKHPVLLQGRRPMSMRSRPRPALTLRGFGVNTAAKAKRAIERHAPTILFDLDLASGLPFEPARRHAPMGRPIRPAQRERTELQFPRNSYDPEPLALYAYARAARGMPLLEFLAYYQCLEFYFPRYSDAEARRRVGNLLRDPRFDERNDRDLMKVIEAASAGRQSRGGEREQLRAALLQCVEEGEVRDFISADDEREKFFKTRKSKLTDKPIFLKYDGDLRHAAAERIYDIRCKIVHTKDGGGGDEVELLLPNSVEAQMLDQDIALVQLLASRVILSSSRSFK